MAKRIKEKKAPSIEKFSTYLLFLAGKTGKEVSQIVHKSEATIYRYRSEVANFYENAPGIENPIPRIEAMVKDSLNCVHQAILKGNANVAIRVLEETRVFNGGMIDPGDVSNKTDMELMIEIMRMFQEYGNKDVIAELSRTFRISINTPGQGETQNPGIFEGIIPQAETGEDPVYKTDESALE